MQRHELGVRAFLFRLCRDHAAADDLAQEAFLRSWKGAQRFAATSSYRTWLYGIAWNSFLADARATRRRRRLSAALEALPPPAGSVPAADDIRRAISRLDPRDQAIMVLCLAHGFTHVEAADILAMPLGSLKSRAARARRLLANTLGDA